MTKNKYRFMKVVKVVWPQRFFSTTGMPRMLQIQLCTFRPSVRGDKPHSARGEAACNSSNRGAPPKKAGHPQNKPVMAMWVVMYQILELWEHHLSSYRFNNCLWEHLLMK